MLARICKEWFFGLRCELTVAFGRSQETGDGGGSRVEGGGAGGELFFFNLRGQGSGNRFGWHRGRGSLCGQVGEAGKLGSSGAHKFVKGRCGVGTSAGGC